MTDTEIPTGRQAARAWKRLDRGVRKDVWRRGRQGLGHPDPAVAAIAVGQARYILSRSYAVRYAGRLFVALPAALGLAALLNRVGSPDPFLYVIAVTVAVPTGIVTHTMARREAKQVEEANLNTLRAGHTDHGSPD
jgi:hypothetical protein